VSRGSDAGSGVYDMLGDYEQKRQSRTAFLERLDRWVSTAMLLAIGVRVGLGAAQRETLRLTSVVVAFMLVGVGALAKIVIAEVRNGREQRGDR